MVREFSRLHGGEAWVTSEVGVGSKFYVEIPMQPQNVVPEEKAQTAEPTGAPTKKTAVPTMNNLMLSDLAANSGKTEDERRSMTVYNEAALKSHVPGTPKVLYVDDNAELRSYVSRVLKGNYTVFLGRNGREGQEMAEKYKPDLILSDLMMPEVDGLQFCRWVRGNKDLQHTPFVLLTARGSVDSKLEGLETGADDYINKPFSESELQARIKNLIMLREHQVRWKQELLSARNIQQALLPPLQQSIKGYDFGVLYRSCEELSGDFFDIYPTEDGALFYVADVTSHGAASAQVTLLLKSIFKSLIEQYSGQWDLGKMAGEIRQRYSTYKLPYSIGLFLARIKFDTGEGNFTSSNFPSPVLVKPDGTENLPSLRNPLIDGMNLTGPNDFEVGRFKIQPGQKLFVFTDGAIEFKNAQTGREFSLREFTKILKSSIQKDWSEHMFSQLVNVQGHDAFKDDITVMRIERT